MKTNFKNEKGITLVALVVTIIVLLILAGVSLSLVAGSDGIITKAATAVSETELKSAIEQSELKIAELIADFYEAKYVKGEIEPSTSKLAYIAETMAYKSGKVVGDYTLTIGTDGAVSVKVTKTGVELATTTLSEDGNLSDWTPVAAPTSAATTTGTGS